MTSFNNLSAAELERIALLMEECGEVVQVCGKILRHGYESRHPMNPHGPTNRRLLEQELGDVRAAVSLLVIGNDVRDNAIDEHKRAKQSRLYRYLHHQPPPPVPVVRQDSEPRRSLR